MTKPLQRSFKLCRVRKLRNSCNVIESVLTSLRHKVEFNNEHSTVKMKHSRSEMPADNCCLAMPAWVSVGIFSQSLRRVGLLVSESEANVFDRPSFSLCNQIAIPAAIGTPALENMVLSNLAVSREECSIVDCRWGKGTWQKMATDSRRAF